MRHEIFDKILIEIMIIAAIFLMNEKVMAIHVCFALISVIILSIDEITKRETVAVVLGGIIVCALLFYPLILIVIPANIYILVNKQKRLSSVMAFAVILMPVIINKASIESLIFLFISIVAAYISYMTAYYETVINKSNSMFDEARKEAIESNHKRQLFREQKEADIYTAKLKERNRIAREIHDNVGHMLTRAILELQAVKVINKDENIKPYIENIDSTINEAMTNIRKSVHELHDDSIDLSIGINEIAALLKENFNVTVNTSIDSPVSNEMKMQILGIIKEAVTNIAKHSNGKKVIVEVVENVTFWRIKIFDDGKSKKLELSGKSDLVYRGEEGGIGLNNISKRAETLGGRTMISAGDDGFTVLVTIPKNKREV